MVIVRPLILALFLMLSLSGDQLFSQGVVVEIVQVHTGDPIPELAGFTTYRVYYVNDDIGDFVSLIFANPDPNGAVACTNTELGFTLLNGSLYQSPIGTCVPPPGCGLLPFFEELNYDSWLTIGAECNNADVFVASLFDIPSNFCAAFEAGNPVILNTGGWYTIQDFPNGFIGCGHKILIAQFTANGDWTFCFNMQGQIQGLPGLINTYGFCDLCVSSFDAVPAYDDDFMMEAIPGNSCIGEGTQLDFLYILPSMLNAVGSNFQLFSTSDPNTPIATGLPPYNDLGSGTYFVVGTHPTSGCVYTSNEVTIIDEPGGLSITSSVDTSSICDGIVDITLNVLEGTEPFSYSLDGVNFQLTPTFAGVACQTYEALVVDGTGCEGEITVQPACSSGVTYDLQVVFDPCSAQPTGSVNGAISATPGPLSVNLTGPSGSQSFNGNSPLPVSVTNLEPGLYELEVTDGNGCSEVFEFDIPEPTPFEVSVIPADALCFEECTGSASAVVQGGIGNISYSWNGTVGGPNVNGLCAGSQTLVATDQAGCIQTVNFQVGQPAALAISAVITAVSCNGQADGAVVISASGGTPEFQFSLGGAPQSDGSFNGLTAGAYTATVIDENGCTQTQAIQVNEPAPIVLTANTLPVSCFGLNNGSINASVTGGAATGTFVLTPGNLTQPTGQFTGLAPGSYTVGYTDSNGCLAEPVTGVIEEPEELLAVVVETTPTSCGGECTGSVEIAISGGTGPFDILYNGTPIVPGNFCVGEYTAVITDANGCTASVDFEIEGPEPLGIILIVNAATCTGMCDGSAIVNVVGGTPPVALSFSPPCQGQLNGPGTLTDLCEGVCSVTATDSEGCSVTEFLVVPVEIETDMELFMFSSPVSCWNQQDGTATVMVTGGNLPISYSWNDPIGQITATAIGLAEETYEVTVTDQIGCTLSSTVVVEMTEGCFFIADVLTPNGDGMNDFWVIGGLEYFPASVVKVFNRWGQVMFESRGYTVPWDGTHNGQRLPVADYYYIIEYSSDKDPILGTVTIKY